VLKHLKERRQSEEGFTLIELMVVVLIMGILMAIAIPTFLATQGSAHDASAKSNATNALTNEKAYFESNQVFTTGAASLDSNLPWGSAPAASNTVSAVAGTTASGALTAATTGTALLIEASSKSGNCFYIADDESLSTPVLGYAETSGACLATSAVTLPTSAPLASAGNAGANIDTGTTLTTWYTSW
jgi:type IV pilus assembly protein PilA